MQKTRKADSKLPWRRSWYFRLPQPKPTSTFLLEKFKLQNGMRVVLSRDNAVPVIAVYVIYDVGSRSKSSNT